jgi:sirohydrochlorin cobaltochelatase
MHKLTKELGEALAHGRNRIGQLVMLSELHGAAYVICHQDDQKRVEAGEWDELERLTQPRQAREWGLYSADGEYRFTKGQANLRSGFVYVLEDLDSLRLTLDHFYPAQLAIWVANRDGYLKVQNLYDKLGRQTGMYRFAKTISTEGAQQLVKKICGPDNQCLKRILWQLDQDTPLEDSKASRFNGVLEGIDERRAIPMQCQEACNFFVAECRKVSRAEFAAKNPEQ